MKTTIILFLTVLLSSLASCEKEHSTLRPCAALESGILSQGDGYVELYFTAQGSTGGDGVIIQVRIDKDNDGIFDSSYGSTNVYFTQRYTESGDYTVTLEVENDLGQTDQDHENIHITINE